jgi:predicted transcriptional regulator of viral defense system
MEKNPDTFKDRALALTRARGIARARDYQEAGIPLVYLKRLRDDGSLIQLGRGLYQIAGAAGTDVNHSLAEAARIMPKGVICLLSALRYYDLTTQLPHAVWITLPRNIRKPTSPAFPVEVVYATEPTYSAQIEHVQVEGVDVPIYSIAKTVADCFKHRRRIGQDVAVEALRDAVRRRKETPGQIMEAARIDRVSAIMKPYLEALT